jgi:hypothetical protein
MKVYIGDREGEKARLLSLGIHPVMIYPNGDLNSVGIPSDLTLRVAGLRVPTPKEAKYISSLLETIGCYSPVWTIGSNGAWYATSAFDNVVNMAFDGASARLVLLEMEG